jgi:hypothetical protein
LAGTFFAGSAAVAGTFLAGAFLAGAFLAATFFAGAPFFAALAAFLAGGFAAAFFGPAPFFFAAALTVVRAAEEAAATLMRDEADGAGSEGARTVAVSLRDVLGDTNYLSSKRIRARQGPYTSRAASPL